MYIYIYILHIYDVTTQGTCHDYPKPLQATSNQDAARGPAQVKWRPCPSEDGGPVKMEGPWPKVQATIKKYW